MVFSDRSLKPHFPELKHAYQWITIREKDIAGNLFTFKNRYHSTNLNSLTAKWELSEDGKVISSGNLVVDDVAPGAEKDIKIPYTVTPRTGAEYFLRVSFQLAKDELWAAKGYEVASQQFLLPVSVPAVNNKSNNGTLKVEETAGLIRVKGPGFSLDFDKAKGTFSRMEENGQNILQQDGGLMLHLWRAPHQKDDMWAYPDWEKKGLKKPCMDSS